MAKYQNLYDSIPHPGNEIRHAIEKCGITVTEAARALGITRQSLDRVMNKRGGLSPEMAVRLSLVFNGRTDREWLKLQFEYDLALARKGKIEVNKRYSKKSMESK